MKVTLILVRKQQYCLYRFNFISKWFKVVISEEKIGFYNQCKNNLPHFTDVIMSSLVIIISRDLIQWDRPDLNRRPPAPEAGILPIWTTVPIGLKYHSLYL